MPAIAALLIASAPVPAYGGDATFLSERAKITRAIDAHIAGARRRIWLDWFIFGGDLADRRVAQLAAKHAAGVDVRVMLDAGLGAHPALRPLARATRAKLVAAGIPVKAYAGHDHQKLLVVDDRAAVVSSLNFGGPLILSRDMGVAVTGGAAYELARDMRAAWGDPSPGLFEPGRRVPTALVRVVPTDPQHAGPDWRAARPTVLDALAGARRGVDVAMLKLTDPAAIDALAAAARRGVRVRVLLDPGRHGRLVPGGWAPPGLYNLGAARALSAAGAEVRWYRPWPHELALHAKACGVDGKRLLIGSTNWTADGFDGNRETMLDVTGGGAPGAYAHVFDRLWRKHAEPAADAEGPGGAFRAWLYGGLARLAD